jgi:hypothetical protein
MRALAGDGGGATAVTGHGPKSVQRTSSARQRFDALKAEFGDAAATQR